jgi:hypothetical protein
MFAGPQGRWKAGLKAGGLSPPLLLLNYRVTVYTVTNTAYDTRHLLLVL